MDNLIKTISDLTGRILFTVPLFVFGAFHFLNASGMAGMVPLPFGIFWIYLTGTALLAGAVGIITDYKNLGPLAAFLVGVMIAIFALSIHLPGIINAADEASRIPSLMNFLKDTGLAGGAWVISGTYRH